MTQCLWVPALATPQARGYAGGLEQGGSGQIGSASLLCARGMVQIGIGFEGGGWLAQAGVG